MGLKAYKPDGGDRNPMQCKRCKTTMVRTHMKEFEYSRQEWYDCPVCGLVQFITEPLSPMLKAWLDSLDGKHNQFKWIHH